MYPARTDGGPLGQRQAARRLSWAAAALAAGVAAQPLLHGLPRGHDTLLHLYRIPVINALWQEGIFFSRWVPTLLAGYGYPLFVFYPPLSAYLVTALYWLLGQNAPLAMVAVSALAITVAAVCMVALGSELYGPGSGAVVAATYVLSPHLLYQVYARGSISNALAMALYPLVAWSLLRLVRRPSSRSVALAAVALAGVLLAHAAASLVVIGPLLVLSVVACVASATSRDQARRSLTAVLGALLLGLALASFSWLPALAENGQTHYLDALSMGDAHWSKHFAQVLSFPDLPIAPLRNPSLPLSTGVAPLVLGALGSLVSVALVVGYRRQGKHAPHVEIITMTAGALGLAAVIMASPVSAPIWEASAPLRLLQFPWRLLDAGTFLLSLSAGRLFALLLPRPRLAVALGVATSVLLVLNALPYMYPVTLSELPAQPTLEDVSAYERATGAFGLTSWGEYLPLTVQQSLGEWLWTDGAVDASLDSKIRLPEGVTLLSSSGGALAAHLEVDAETDTAVRFRSFWYPGWSVRIDGATASCGPDAEGLIEVSVPAGRHTLDVRWGRTLLRTVADLLSLVAWGVTCVLLCLRAGGQMGDSARAAPLCQAELPLSGSIVAVLLIFAMVKPIILDRVDTPLVRHPADLCPREATCLPWGTFAGQVRLTAYELSRDEGVLLYWTPEQVLVNDYGVEVTWVDATGVPVRTLTRDHPGGLPTSQWSAGELIQDRYQWDPPASVSPTAYRIEVSLVDGPSAARPQVTDAPDPGLDSVLLGTVRYPAHAPEPQPSERGFDVVFGDVIKLSGVDLASEVATGVRFDYALRWQSLEAIPTDYTVLVHLLDDAGELVAGDDDQPLQGLYPTSVWEPGEVVLDKRRWELDVPPGEYTVEVGLYQLTTGERLTVSSPGAFATDSVIIGRIQVTDE